MLAMLANSFFKFDCRPSVWDKLSVRNTLGNYPPKGACEMNCNEGRKGQGVGGGTTRSQLAAPVCGSGRVPFGVDGNS